MQTHEYILGVALFLIRVALALCSAAAATVHAAPSCKSPEPLRLIERFMSADCESCWAADGLKSKAGRTMVLDWIVPGSATAPLAVGAVNEATARAGVLTSSATKQQSNALKAAAPRLRIADGPAWNGYIGLQLTVHRNSNRNGNRNGKLPEGAVAYMALVERMARKSEGTALARQLVRNVVGPLSLEELASVTPVRHFRAMRLPDGARAEKLASVAWVESAEGKVIAATQSADNKCKIAL
jgi:hypothetical protein